MINDRGKDRRTQKRKRRDERSDETAPQTKKQPDRADKRGPPKHGREQLCHEAEIGVRYRHRWGHQGPDRAQHKTAHEHTYGDAIRNFAPTPASAQLFDTRADTFQARRHLNAAMWKRGHGKFVDPFARRLECESFPPIPSTVADLNCRSYRRTPWQ